MFWSWSTPIVQGHDSAEVHWAHVIRRSGHDLLDNNSIRLFRWMEWIPKSMLVSVGAQVGDLSA